MKIILLPILMFVFLGCTTSTNRINNGMGYPKIPEEKIKTGEEWLQVKYNQLSKIKNIADVKQVRLTRSPHKNDKAFYKYCPSKPEGLIYFDDKTWVLFFCHSSHHGLGDYTLIRTSSNKYYYNEGHACLPIILLSKENINSLDSFLRAVGARSEPWKLYKSEQRAP